MPSSTLRKFGQDYYVGSRKSKKRWVLQISYLTHKLCRNSLQVFPNQYIEPQVSPIDC